ncbi:MAG: CapA family protein [Patescibacteria group bacterium]|nr:CapA family protein [Patescibacteria group bacterium]MDD5294387.1 CapA family protein [Patescibacteria group bacterium]MDD5554666.1 CapA family protein [Patescibacteria group bacterium]
MDFPLKTSPKKLIKTLSLAAVLLTALFLILAFYSEIKRPNNHSLLTPGQEDGKIASLKILFLGDLMLDRHVGEKISQKGFSYLFENLDEKNFFSGHDLISGNLEGAVTDNGAHYKPEMSYDFSFSPEIISNLKKYNFNFFNLANNHFADQGERGIIETRNNLETQGFYYSGCPDGQTGDCSGKIIEIAGKKIGLTGFSMVYRKFDEAAAKKIIENLAGQTDMVIVNIHWGTEYEHRFNKIQQEVAHTLIDTGADIIIGHHPHVVQGLEIYKNKPIFYSLGNFIFDQYFSSDTQEELAVGVELTEEKTKFSLYPLKSKLSQPELMAEPEKEKFFSDLIAWSDLPETCKKQIKQGKLIIEE